MKARLDKAGIPVNFRGTCITQTGEARRFHAYHALRKGQDIPIRDAANILKTLGLPQHKSLLDKARLAPHTRVTPSEMEAFGVKLLSDRRMCDYLANKPRHVHANRVLFQIASKFGLEATVAQPKVTLTTYHGSKGREANTTILITDCSPSAMEYAVRNLDYERRVAYVGLTRAKEEVNICRPQTDSYMRAFR